MAELPPGTVTFLFTDIEGSTQLLRDLGDGYASVWKQHQLIIREALAATGGGAERTEGGALFPPPRAGPPPAACADRKERPSHATFCPPRAARDALRLHCCAVVEQRALTT